MIRELNLSFEDHENNRLKCLRSYNVLDTDKEEELDLITQLASDICETQFCFISLVDRERLWFKSTHGLSDVSELPNHLSFCYFAIQQDELYEVPDTLLDSRHAAHPFVIENKFRFYAGMPLKSPDGYNIGTICVLDMKPKKLNEAQKNSLKVLSKSIMKHLELLKTHRDLVNITNTMTSISKTKDEFFSNVGHELRTPLNAISGFSELLLKTNMSKDQEDMVSTVKASCEVMLTLVNDILDLSKLDCSKLYLNKNIFNIKKEIVQIHALLNVKTQCKDVTFDYHIDDDIPEYLKGDRVRLHQIVTNLVGNAIKFTHKGKIQLLLSYDNNTDRSRDGIGIKFLIQDTGIGIEKNRLEAIFDRFEQANINTSLLYGGTGLGLNITKKLVELHGSRLNVESQVDKGSKFYFSIHYDIPTNEEVNTFCTKEKELERAEIEKFQNKKFMIFEDNDFNFKFIHKVLSASGVSISRANNGKQGIEILKRENFDLILMDLNMPEMNGFKATEFIRQTMKINTPIVALTANCSNEEKQECLHLGMNEYLTKPFKPKEFIDKISLILNEGNIVREKSKNYAKEEVRLLFQKRKKDLNNKPINKFKHTNQSNNFPRRICASNKDLNSKEGNVSPKLISQKLIKTNDSPLKTSIEKDYSKFPRGYLDIFLERLSLIDSGYLLESNKTKHFENVNLSVLKHYCCNDDELQMEMIQLFLNDTPKILDDLEYSLNQKDNEKKNFLTQKLKSYVTLFGLDSTRENLETIGDIKITRHTFIVLEQTRQNLNYNCYELRHFIN